MIYKGKYISVSRAKQAEKCLLAFRFRYVDKAPQGVSEPAEFGKLCHAALESVYAWVVDEEHTGEIPGDIVARCYRAAFECSPLAGVELFREGIELVRQYCSEQGEVSHRRVLAVEKKFSVDLGGGCTAFGFIDRVDRLPGDVVEVIDYKTNRSIFSRSEVDSDIQMSVYGLAARKLWPWAKEVRFRFDLLRHAMSMRTTRSDQELTDARDYLVALNARLHSLEDFPARINPLCGWCDYRDGCEPFKNALAGDAPSPPARLAALGMNELLNYREQAAAAEKIAKGRKFEIDAVVKERLSDEGQAAAQQTEGWSVSLRSSQETHRPSGPTLRVLGECVDEWGLNLSREQLVDEVCVVDNKKIAALSGRLPLSSARRQLLSVRLDTVARVAAKRPFLSVRRLAPSKSKKPKQ
ncbi:MAG: PD-(D/E)XK nuclease family protein [bacterium]|nr:PD-(D/E)XK nuclease family protein [bacterium]